MRKYLSIAIVFFVFLAIILPSLLSRGMFMDGLLYAAVSKNMAFGDGNFWQPQLSTTILNPFYEHPPLAIGMQSLFFYVFGDKYWVEDLYQLVIAFLIGYVMIKIWKELNQKASFSWLPLALLLVCPLFFWSVKNGMLETTMTLFVCSGLLFYIKSMKVRWFLIFSGICISLAFLSKGVFCLYLWGMPFVFWLVKKEVSFARMTLDSLVLIVGSIGVIALVILLDQQAYDYLYAYINNQVIGSVENVKTVSSRWSILIDFFSESIVIWLLLLISLVLKRIKIKQLVINKNAIALFLIVFSGVLPIMLSMKQRGFYTLSVFPFLAIAVAILLFPFVEELLNRWSKEIRLKIQKIVLVSSILACLSVLVFYPKQSALRDKDLLEITDVVNKHIPAQGGIGISTQLRQNWSLISYLARYGGYSLHLNGSNMKYYLLQKGKDELPPNTKVIDESSGFYLVQTVSQ